MLSRMLNHGIPLQPSMISEVQDQYDRAGNKRGRLISILANQSFYNFCELRNFELQFTGEKLRCMTQADKARMLAAKTQAQQQRESTNRVTYGQYRRNGPGPDYGKRPRN
jgi:hypothetical protein